MLLRNMHGRSVWHWTVGNQWRGRSSFFLHQEIH
jgi:hypothetical protein